jgi:hypothetical protein
MALLKMIVNEDNLALQREKLVPCPFHGESWNGAIAYSLLSPILHIPEDVKTAFLTGIEGSRRRVGLVLLHPLSELHVPAPIAGVQLVGCKFLSHVLGPLVEDGQERLIAETRYLAVKWWYIMDGVGSREDEVRNGRASRGVGRTEWRSEGLVERLRAVDVEAEGTYVNSNSIRRKVWVVRVQFGCEAYEAIAFALRHVSKARNLLWLSLAWVGGMWR